MVGMASRVRDGFGPNRGTGTEHGPPHGPSKIGQTSLVPRSTSSRVLSAEEQIRTTKSATCLENLIAACSMLWSSPEQTGTDPPKLQRKPSDAARFPTTPPAPDRAGPNKNTDRAWLIPSARTEIRALRVEPERVRALGRNSAETRSKRRGAGRRGVSGWIRCRQTRSSKWMKRTRAAPNAVERAQDWSDSL